MTETEKEEKNKAAYLDLPNFWLTSRPWLMLAFIGAFIFCQLLVFKHGFPESTLETLISAQGTFFFSVLIAAVGLIAAVFFFFRYKFLCDELEKAEKMVSGARNDGQSIDFLALEEGFATLGKPFPELYAEYSRSVRPLRREDGSYELSKVDMDGLTDFVSLRPSADFFNEDTLYYSRINVPLYQSVPGILTGLGILFTFVGLAAGVSLATRGLLPADAASAAGIGSMNVAELLKSIGNLLDGAGQAFITSIVGLFISFFFSSWLQGCEHNVLSRIEKLNAKLASYITHADPERLALIRTMRTIRQEELMRSFSEHWDMMSDKFIEKLGNVLNEQSTAQTSALVGAIDALRDSFDKFSEKQSQAITDEVRQAMEEFSVMLSKNMQDMTASFAQSAEGVGKSVEALDVVLSSTREVMTSVSQEVGDTMKAFSQEVDALDKKVAERTASIEAHLEAMNRHSAEIAERIEAVGLALVESAETAGTGFAEKVDTAVTGFAYKVQGAGDDLVKTVESAGGVVHEAFVQAGNTVTERMGAAAQEFSDKIVGSSVDGAERIRETFSAINERVSDFGSAMAELNDRQRALTEQIIEAGKEVRTAASDLSLCIQRCTDALDKSTTLQADGEQISRDMFDRAREVCSMITTTSEDSLKKVTTSLTEFVQTADMLKNNAENIEKLLLESTERLGSALMRLNDAVSTNMSVTDQSLSGAIDSMSSALKEWTSMQENATEKLSARTAEFKESVDLIAEAARMLGGSVGKLSHATEAAAKKTEKDA